MPEMPEMQALAERLDGVLRDQVLEGVTQLGFTALKTVQPAPADLVGRAVTAVGRRGKFVLVHFGAPAAAADDPTAGPLIALHLSQAGRLDLERPPKATKPRGSVARFLFAGGLGVLVREHGTQRKAGWWILGPGDAGPMASLGPEALSPEFRRLVTGEDSTRQLNSWLRDQRVVAGIGRGWSDDILNRAGLSPFASLRGLTADQRAALLDAVTSVLHEALELERRREGGLSENKLGDRFGVHNRSGQPCPVCGETMHRVSFESHEITYCPHCQTKGKILADRRMSKLLR